MFALTAAETAELATQFGGGAAVVVAAVTSVRMITRAWGVRNEVVADENAYLREQLDREREGRAADRAEIDRLRATIYNQGNPS